MNKDGNTFAEQRVTTTPASVWQNPVHFFAFGCGAGCLHPGPGTWGSLWAIPLYCAFAPYSVLGYTLILAALMAIGIWLCDTTTHDIGVYDHPGIVFDEIVGLLIGCAFLPATISWLMAAFVLFRVLDIFKPPPIDSVEAQFSGGLGIMLDDVVAGMMTCLILHILRWCFF